ncbi:MAG: DUF2062 domain-containing protein [Candidatus Omnitrophota bacterium]|nr:DUF2062 domain-containing protein [Candidatus Omnitrophota bacterium]
MQGKQETLKDKIIRLLKLNNSPHEIALGVGLGAFIAIMPLYGLHTIMVIIAALLIRRVNKIALLVGTNVSLPPTVPFITWIGYSIGRFILGNDYPAFNWLDFKHFSLKNFMQFYYLLFVGSLIEGFICAIILYFLTRHFVKKHLSPKNSAITLK